MTDAAAESRDQARRTLVEIVQGRTEDEIVERVNAMGVDSLLDRILEGMRSAFVAERAGGAEAVIQWDVAAPDAVRSYQLEVAGGECVLHRGTPLAPRVTLSLSLPDFLRFVAGQLDAMQAFLSGRLRLSGDVLFAQSMRSWFAD